MYEYKVKEVVKVVDGDTVDFILDLGFSLYKKERCRVAGIDTPESRTRNLTEKQYGKEATAFLKGQLENADQITVRTSKDGKYGRMLGTIMAKFGDSTVNINELMVEAGYAVAYNGGTKMTVPEILAECDRKRAEYAEKYHR